MMLPSSLALVGTQTSGQTATPASDTDLTVGTNRRTVQEHSGDGVAPGDGLPQIELDNKFGCPFTRFADNQRLRVRIHSFKFRLVLPTG